MKTKTLRPQALEKATTQFVQKQFTIGVILPLTEAKGADLFFSMVEPLCELGFSFKVLAVGDPKAQQLCYDLSQRFADQFELLESIPANHARVLQTSQVVWFNTSPDLAILKELARKGGVPIMPYDDKLIDFANFDVQQEQGNCFLYNPEHQWEAMAMIIRAYENFKFPYDWGNLRKNFKKVFGV